MPGFPYLYKMKWFLIIVGCFFLCEVNAQIKADTFPEKHFTSYNLFLSRSFSPTGYFDFQKASQQKVFGLKTSGIHYDINYLPGLFCKLEHQLESKSKLAPRFRLGSLQYTEWMEGKSTMYPGYFP